MNFKLGFVLLAVGVIGAGVLPFGMSQVQEDAFMEIDMLSTQVENPFRIQDENNIDVFAIDTYGHVTTNHNVRQFAYSSGLGEEITGVDWVLADITTPTHAGVLKYWELSYDGDTVIDSFPVMDSHGSSIGGMSKTLGGLDACRFSGEYSTNNGVSWQNLQGTPLFMNGGVTYDSDTNWDAEAPYYDVTDLRVVVYTTASLDTCIFKNLMINQLFHIPNWMTVNEIR